MKLYWFFILLFVLFPSYLYSQETSITIHTRGVNECKISLIPLSGLNILKPVIVVENIKNEETATLNLLKDNLPGEFVLRFDYKENENSTPYPSEKRIIIGNQSLSLWTNPVYCNNIDSSWFQKDERENSAYSVFIQENSKKKSMLNLLQNFLINYDDPESPFYKAGINEYEKKRLEYNEWIASQIKQSDTLFISSIIGFEYIPKIDWNGSESQRKLSLRTNYFSLADFSNRMILKTSAMKGWMDGYVNMYGELATSIALRDSLFAVAGKTAIEKAKNGDPLVYGWMVDYFFKGYESLNIQSGIKMLEPYLNDPNCLTVKRKEIIKRLKGIETMVPGTKAPDIVINNSENGLFKLYNYTTGGKYILILFWSADCSHCQEMVGKLYPWYQQEKIRKSLDVLAISLDETDTEVQAWHHKSGELRGWIHLRASEGMRSKVANDYFILGVPVIFLINARTKDIIGMPESIEQLNALLSL